MIDEELTILQKELEQLKYSQSEIVKQDLGGRMDYCDGCAFKKFDTNKNHHICNLDYISVNENKVCAKNKMRNTKSISK